MRKILIIFLTIALSQSSAQTRHELDSLKSVLEKVSADDQRYRSGWDTAIQQYGLNSPKIIGMIRQMNFQDSLDMKVVGAILDQYGWLSKDQTSDSANDALFLVLQHATLPFQLKYLPLMERAVAAKKAKASDYALLVDRTNMFQGKLQIYGSQVTYDARGNIHLFPITDEPNVDRRRSEVGLPGMQVYLHLFNPHFVYTLPKKDRFKNKIAVRGLLSDLKSKQPLSGVSVDSPDGKQLGISDSGGYYMVLLDRTLIPAKLIFKKRYFDSIVYPVTDTTRQVIDFNPSLKRNMDTRQ